MLAHWLARSIFKAFTKPSMVRCTSRTDMTLATLANKFQLTSVYKVPFQFRCSHSQPTRAFKLPRLYAQLIEALLDWNIASLWQPNVVQVLATQAMIYLPWHTKHTAQHKHKGLWKSTCPCCGFGVPLRLDNNSKHLAKPCIPLKALLNAELLRTRSDLSNRSSAVHVHSYLRVSKQSANSNAQFPKWNCRIAILFELANAMLTSLTTAWCRFLTAKTKIHLITNWYNACNFGSKMLV